MSKERMIYGYARTARADSSQIEKQINIINEYASRENLKVDKIFVDDGISGILENLDGTELKELDKKIMDNAYQGSIVIIKDISRISRNRKTLESIFLRWKAKNVNLVLVSEKQCIA